MIRLEGQVADRVCFDVPRSDSVSVDGFVFQACSFNHSDISPYLLESAVYRPVVASRSHHANPLAPPSISRCWRASIVVLNRSEAAREDRVGSVCLAECPVRPLLKSRCTEGIVERGFLRRLGTP